jgi:undecaprenyl diphosphate synthase
MPTESEEQAKQPHEALHIAIIPDGNRRWAKERGLHPWKGHERAIENFRSITEWCHESPDVSILTVWCFSTENWKRDPAEVNELMSMLEKYLQKERKGFLEKKTRFLHSGRRDRLPSSLVRLLGEVERETAKEKALTLHLAVDYGGKDEVVRALKRLEGREVTEESIRHSLDHPELPDIDLIIRTSGELRTSNFCLWQAAYAEWKFCSKHFPDFTTQDLQEAIHEFHSRSRRYGN